MTEMFEAFGDESCGEKVVAYGVLVVPEAQLPAVESLLVDVKKAFGGSPADPLHCRELFAPHARLKSAWAKLSMNNVFELYATLAEAIRDAGLRRIIVLSRRVDFPDAVPPLSLEHIDPTSGEAPHTTKGFRLGEKQLAAFCAQAAMIPLSKNPGLDNVRFWPDPDKTAVEWVDGKQSASGINTAFIDVGPGTEPPRVKVMKFSSTEKPSALQIADFIAYAGQRGSSGGTTPKQRKFRRLFEAVAPEVLRFRRAPDGGFGVSVPNASLNR
jgi:hypothetical protein